jgi:hypothetical protein
VSEGTSVRDGGALRQAVVALPSEAVLEGMAEAAGSAEAMGAPTPSAASTPSVGMVTNVGVAPESGVTQRAVSTTPVQLSRAEDLTAAIERMRPIPQGGAMLEVEAPGLGAIRLHVAMQGETVQIRIHVQGGTDAVSWFAREHDGLCSAARQAVPESAGVELQLHCGADDRRGGSSARGRDDEDVIVSAPARTVAKMVTPGISTSRSLVDVIA